MKCPTCGAGNPEDAEWCNQCLTRFGDTGNPVPPGDAAPGSDRPDAPSDGAGNVGRGDPAVVRRAEDSTAFLHTTSTTLTRLAAGGPLFYVEPGGDPQAVVTHQRLTIGVRDRADAALAGESQRHLDDRFSCFDLEDTELFHVERYRAVNETAFTVFDPEGLPLATYLRQHGVVHREVEVREGTGANVATMRSSHDRWELVETGGAELGFCWAQDKPFVEVVDQEWGLTVFDRPSVLDRRALIALPLVCWLFWYPGPRRRAQNGLGTGVGLSVDVASLVMGTGFGLRP